MKKYCLVIPTLLLFAVCSQESTPYEEINQTLPDPHQKAYIKTH